MPKKKAAPKKVPSVPVYNGRYDVVSQAVHDVLAMQPEFLEPALRLERAGIRQTLVFFGAAKILPPDVAERELKQFERKFKKLKRKTRKHWDGFDHATDAVYMSRYYQAARELAFRLAKWSATLPADRDYVIATGSGPGIMEAANRGALEAGGRSVGFGIEIPSEQKPNDYISEGLYFHFHSFLPRKFWLMFPARALVVFPGGIGTMDELFEVYTLMKTRKATRTIPIILYGKEYWSELLNLKTMVRFGTCHASDLDYIRYVDSVDEAFNTITEALNKLEG